MRQAPNGALSTKNYLKNFTMDCVLEDINDDLYEEEDYKQVEGKNGSRVVLQESKFIQMKTNRSLDKENRYKCKIGPLDKFTASPSINQLLVNDDMH